jgi:hypothetical protein
MTFQPYIIVLILFWGLVLFLSWKEAMFARKLPNEDKKYLYWTQVIIFIGVLLRTLDLGSFPAGVFVDEAINGYDSWCLVNYGVDQHLASYPVYLHSWGSGQSALYAYMGAPFIKMFGLSPAVYRLPMALLSCISIVVFYHTYRKFYNKNYLIVFIITLLLFLNPWHIMKSRWALDCNVTPDFILLAVSFIIWGYNSISLKKQSVYYAISGIFLVLAAYGYGVSWFMLPAFVLLLGIYLYRRKKINVWQIGFCLIVMLVVAFPLLLFAITLVSGGEEYRFGFLTITQLKESRHVETTLLGRYSFMNVIYLAWYALKLMLWGDDGLLWNGFRYIGQFYNLPSIPFFIVACYQLIKKKKGNSLDTLFLIWLIASIPIMLIVSPNTNHWNILWFPIIYFIARGLVFCIERAKWAKIASVSVICVFACIFIVKYINTFSENNLRSTGFDKGIEKQIRFIGEKHLDKIYYSDRIAHVVLLFFNPVNPYEFDKTKEVKNLDMPIEYMKKYTNNYFYLPADILPLPRTAYIIRNSDLSNYKIDYNKFSVERGDYYTVLWNE